MHTIISLLLFIHTAAAGPYEEATGRVSDVGVGALVVAPLVVTYAQSKDWKKTGLAAGALALNGASTFVGKSLVSSARPDGSGMNGWPSGHTSMAFTGAGLICLQTDPLYCGVALGAAAGVGVLRIEAKRHTPEQVAWGVGFGLLHGVLFPALTASF